MHDESSLVIEYVLLPQVWRPITSGSLLTQAQSQVRAGKWEIHSHYCQDWRWSVGFDPGSPSQKLPSSPGLDPTSYAQGYGESSSLRYEAGRVLFLLCPS